MNWAEFQQMDSERKKKLLLAAILGVLGVYALFTFAISPVIAGHRRSADELAGLRHKLDQAQRSISRGSQIRDEVDLLQDALQAAAREHIPPLENPLSWVAGQVYRSAREVGVDIESVSDLGITSVPWSRFNEVKRVFVPYRVRIVTQCGYGELRRLIQSMEAANPYLCISEIQVSAQEADFDRHAVRISVDWPFWLDLDRARQLTQKEEGEQHG